MSQQSTPGRRRFLFGAGAASVAGVAGIASTRKVRAPVGVSKAGIPAGRGYELTEHVRNYYRTTAV